MRTAALAALLALAALPARADDWLAETARAARTAAVLDEPAPEAPKAAFLPYSPASKLFTADVPTEGWWPMEEEGPDGSVFYLLGPDSPTGAFRAVLSVRSFDKDMPGFLDIKRGLDSLRRDDPAVGRRATPVRPIRVGGGALARTFEVVETRRLPSDEGPSFPEELHHYVAVIPQPGDSYFVLRLVSARTDYLDHRDMFVRFMKTFRPLGAR